jgi:hypothetical protein
MYCPHNEHDEVFDKVEGGWFHVSHYELSKNKYRYVYAGDTFTSPKTGKKWQYYRKGNELKVRPFKELAS